MNVIWIVSDSFRRDHLGAYGNNNIRTPSLDALAASAVRFDNHYSAGFPTMPTRADHQTGRWTMSFMGWEPLPAGVTTLAEILAEHGMHTAASVDTPYYLRGGMNYDRGFQSFFMNVGQDTLWSLIPEPGYHNEALDVRAAWRSEADRNAPKTFMTAMRWLEQHYKEDFFLYVDTWDPHEPWDAPPYYTELYWPGYDGELVLPVYGNWHDVPGYQEEQLRKGHATYCGEITMVDTWAGFLLRSVENMGLADRTIVIFTTDHGFYFGEHGGLFGKMSSDKYPDGTLRPYDEPGSQWSYSPLYEEIVHLPLLLRAPGVPPGNYTGITSAVDVMPTVLDLLGLEIPDFVQGPLPRTGAARPRNPGPGFRREQPALRQPRRPGALRGQPAPDTDGAAGDHRDLRRLEPPLQLPTRGLEALQPRRRPQAVDQRHRDPPGRGIGIAPEAGLLHARNGGAETPSGPATGAEDVRTHHAPEDLRGAKRRPDVTHHRGRSSWGGSWWSPVDRPD